MYAFWKSPYFIGGVQKLRIVVPTFGAVHIFFVVAALRGNAISVFVNTSAARACCAGVLARLALTARVAFDDTSNVIFVILTWMPLRCKRRAHLHIRL